MKYLMFMALAFAEYATGLKTNISISNHGLEYVALMRLPDLSVHPIFLEVSILP